MKIVKKASVAWKGGLKSGAGTVSTESGAFNAHPYGFGSRFADQKGTNPEELIGAAHAGCFTMFLSDVLEKAGHTAEELNTTADVTLEISDAGSIDITTIVLNLSGKVPGIDQSEFERFAKEAKEGCPVSKVLKANITLNTKLV